MMKKLPGVCVDVKPASLTSDHVVRECVCVCVFTEEFKWFFCDRCSKTNVTPISSPEIKHTAVCPTGASRKTSCAQIVWRPGEMLAGSFPADWSQSEPGEAGLQPLVFRVTLLHQHVSEAAVSRTAISLQSIGVKLATM